MMTSSKTSGWVALGLCLGLGLQAGGEPSAVALSAKLAGFVEHSVTLSQPTDFYIEDEYEPEGMRKVPAGSVLLSLPSEWDRAGTLELKLSWAVRDDFPIGEPATPRISLRGALLGVGDYYHPEWLHPDELDLERELTLEVIRPSYGLDQGELIGHPYRGASSTVASMTVMLDPHLLRPGDKLLALYLEPEWVRWPQPGAVDGTLLSEARLLYTD